MRSMKQPHSVHCLETEVKFEHCSQTFNRSLYRSSAATAGSIPRTMFSAMLRRTLKGYLNDAAWTMDDLDDCADQRTKSNEFTNPRDAARFEPLNEPTMVAHSYEDVIPKVDELWAIVLWPWRRTTKSEPKKRVNDLQGG